MSVKEQLLDEITQIDDEVLLQEILDIIALRKENLVKTTKGGRLIRSQKDMENMDCPYPVATKFWDNAIDDDVWNTNDDQ